MIDFLKTMKKVVLFQKYSYDKRWLEIASSVFSWFAIFMIIATFSYFIYTCIN